MALYLTSVAKQTDGHFLSGEVVSFSDSDARSGYLQNIHALNHHRLVVIATALFVCTLIYRLESEIVGL